MTQIIEKTTKVPFLFLLLHFLQIYRATDGQCPTLPSNKLTCYNDYNNTITCRWNSSSVYDHSDDVCTVRSYWTGRNFFNASCHLKSYDVSKPALKNCSLVFKRSYNFMPTDNLTIDVSCMPSKQSEIFFYKPVCHIKLNPPEKPEVNQTTVTWFKNNKKLGRIKSFKFELQWKLKDKSWNDPSLQNKTIECSRDCEAQLDPGLLIKEETYDARLRVQPVLRGLPFPWSDWSLTKTWVSQVGEPKPTPGLLNKGVLTLAALSLLLTGAVLFLRKNKLVYVVKSLKIEPLPDPGKSEMFQDWFTVNSKGQDTEKPAGQTWLSSHFTGESVQSLLSSVDIVSYEVTSTVDAMKFFGPDVKMMAESNTYNSNCSNFSNPSYSELCTSPWLANLKLQACAVDAPYNPFQGQRKEKEIEQDIDLVEKKDLEKVKLLFMGGNEKESVVISDYEKVEKKSAECLRLHSVDSGMCSYEEVSQESIEADSSNKNVGHDEGTPCEEEKEAEEKEGMKTKLDFRMLFGGSESILGKNSIQICSDYKKIPGLQPESPELPSQDSGVSMVLMENESQEDSSGEDNKPSETTCFPFPPHPPNTQPQQPLNKCGSTLSPFLPPLHGEDIFKQIALTGSVLRQSCDEGYMPVRQKEG